MKESLRRRDMCEYKNSNHFEHPTWFPHTKGSPTSYVEL